MNSNIQISKRDGTKEDLELDKLHKVVFYACEGITGVSASVVDGKLNIFGDGSNTTDGSTDDDGAIAISAGASGTLLADLGLTAGTYYSPAFEIAPHTAVPGFKTCLLYTSPSPRD